MPAVLIHLHDPFDATKREIHTLDRPTTVRRLVSRHGALRRHTSVRGPDDYARPEARAAHRRVYGKRRVREFNRATSCALYRRDGQGGFTRKELTRSEWKRAKVVDGDVVAFYVAPAGGGGGSNPLMIVAAVAIVAIMAAAPYLAVALGPLLGITTGAVGSLTLGGTLLAAGIGLALSAGVYGLMSLFAGPAPQQMQATSFGTGTQASPTYNLAIQGNVARLEQPIPELIGQHRIFPDFVGQPYVRYVDNEQYIHMGLGIGIGEYEIDVDTIKIGDTPVTTFEEIDYAIVEPGGAHDADIWDPRWLPSADIATVDLPGAGEDPPSPWKGPFIANPPGTTISRIEFDIANPRGLWVFNAIADDGMDSVATEIEVEVQEIDDNGTALGAWTALATKSETGQSQQPLFWTYTEDLPSAGRWQVRIRRTDTEVVSNGAGHVVQWIGLRGRSVYPRTFAGMTTMDVVMKATGDLNNVTSRKLNLVATRKLPSWSFEYEQMDETLVATRNPCDAFAYIARSANGGRLADTQIDLAGLYEDYDFFDYEGWTFDFVFDQSLTVSEALARVARAVVAERVVQGGKLRLVRDVQTAAPVAMFGPRNIRQGSVEMNYAMVDETSADALIITYMDPVAWKPKDVTIAFDDSAQERPTRITLHGITDRTQARTVGWWLARQNRYRRRVVKWGTEMEGLAVLFGDSISFSHDMPRWGQSMEVLDWDDDSRTMTLSDPPDFSGSAGTHYVAIRDNTGMLAGPFTATAVADQPMQIVVGAGTLPEVYTGGDQERTFVQFGPGEEYARQLKVKQVTPRSEEEAEIVAFDDDPRMYDPIPEDDEPVVVDFEDVVAHITSNTSDVNLRSLANAAGYVGVLNQSVTIIVDAGVTVSASSASVAAMRRGTWPADYAMLTLVNEGTIEGAGGAGGSSGYAGNGNGSAGAIGGTALDSSSGPMTVDNAAGTMRGGGGGGGGGAILVGDTIPPSTALTLYGGGGGGGGQGNAGGPGGVALGTGLEGAGSDGTAGSSGAPGTGGAGAHWIEEDLDEHDAPAGGDGGAWGEPGTAGESGYDGATVRPGGVAGAGGKAVKGNANITWDGTGTLIGNIA